MRCKGCNKAVDEGMSRDNPLCAECNAASYWAIREWEEGAAQTEPYHPEHEHRWPAELVRARYADRDEATDPLITPHDFGEG